MSKLKCPRCNADIKETDIFCMSCGNPVKRDIDKELKKEKKEDNIKAGKEIKEKIETEKIPIEENVIPSKTEQIEKNRKTKKGIVTIILLIIIIIALSTTLVYLLVFKEEKECEVCEKCPEPEVEIIEKEPTYQYVNFNGYRFKIPLDWNFEGDSSEYRFINEEENVYVLISNLNSVSYSTFSNDDYQKIYQEKLQTDYNISINNAEEKILDDKNYYLMEGTYESYKYIIVVTENSNGIFLTEAQFENNSVYTNKKQEVIDFALSYTKNNKL